MCCNDLRNCAELRKRVCSVLSGVVTQDIVLSVASGYGARICARLTGARDAKNESDACAGSGKTQFRKMILALLRLRAAACVTSDCARWWSAKQGSKRGSERWVCGKLGMVVDCARAILVRLLRPPEVLVLLEFTMSQKCKQPARATNCEKLDYGFETCAGN